MVPACHAVSISPLAARRWRTDGGHSGAAVETHGHFEYGLAYGAMDEEGKGTWEIRDGAVFLTSVPVVVLASISPVTPEPERVADQNQQWPLMQEAGRQFISDERSER